MFKRPSLIALCALLACGASPVLAQTIVHAGDKVQVTVFNHSDLSTEALVTSDGDIPLPIAGSVRIAGQSEAAAGTSIQTALTPYLRHPAVAVHITQQAQSIFFTGSMIGVQPYQPGETLGAALGTFKQQAQDPNDKKSFDTSSIDFRDVRIQRDGVSLPTVNMEALTRSGESGPSLEPGDVVLLKAKPVRVDIRGDVKQPTTVYLYSGDTLAQAIAQAGGYSPSNSLADILVTHKDGTTQTVSAASATITSAAHDEDIITLQPAPHVNVLGTVAHPGNTALQTGSTLLSALYEAGGPGEYADFSHIKVMHDGTTTTYNVNRMVKGNLSQDVPLHDGDVVYVPRGSGLVRAISLSTLAVLGSVKYLLVK